MSSTTPGGPDRPWDAVAPRQPGSPNGPDDDGPDDGGPDDRDPFWRRMPVWLLVVIGVVVLGIVVAVVVLLTRPGPAEELEPEVVTLPVPTPTIEAIEREEGTPFFDSLPSTVLVWALTEHEEDEDLLVAGAVEAYRLVYSDGERTLTVQAGQWPTAEAVEEAFEQLLADSPAEGAADAEADDADAEEQDATDAPAVEPDEGVVEVDGEQVGRYVLRPAADGTGELWWTNQSVLIRVQGPADALRDVFAAFPL